MRPVEGRLLFCCKKNFSLNKNVVIDNSWAAICRKVKKEMLI